MRRKAIPAVLGFLVGAAALAGGQGGEDLRGRLLELQEAVAQAMRADIAAAELPPGDDRGHELAIFAVGDLTVPTPQHLPPRHGLEKSGERPVFGGLSEESLLPFGTVEELMELVRGTVEPYAWEGGTTISVSGHRLFVVNRPAVNREVGRFLDQELRSRAHACVTVEAEVVDVAPDGAEERVLEVRATGLAGQRFLAWHGRQVAFLLDPEVEVAQEASTADPVVDVVQAGGSLGVLPSLGDDAERVTVELDFQHDVLGELRRRDTLQGGPLDLPRIGEQVCRTVVTVRDRTWTVVGTGEPRAGKTRLLRIRVTRLGREAGAP